MGCCGFLAEFLVGVEVWEVDVLFVALKISFSFLEGWF